MTNPAEGYESYMVPTLFAPWAARLVEIADPQAGERALDVGCGTGIVARQLASRIRSTGTITAIDASPDMLAVAKAAGAREGVSVDWRQGNAEALTFAAGSFDLVTCQFALMFFADKPAALGEMRRVVSDDGRVVLSVWQGLDRHPFYQTLHEVIQRRIGISALQDIFALGDAEALRAALTQAGFAHTEVSHASITARFPNAEAFLAGEIEVDTAAIPSMRHLDAEARQAIVTAIAEDMKSALDAVKEHDHVVLPFHALMLKALP